MASIKGLLATLLGLDASGDPYALALSEDGYLRASLPGQAGGGTKHNPKGLLICPVGFTPSGLLKNLQVDAGGNLIATLIGGSANQIIKSDGTDAEWDDLLDIITALKLNAGARVYYDDVKVLTTGVWTSIPLNVEVYDTDDIHDNVTNNTRLTCKTAGKYAISGGGVMEGHATGIRYIAVRHNNTTWIAVDDRIGIISGNNILINTQYDLAVNDYVELYMMQNSGGDLDIWQTDVLSPSFMMQRIG